MLSSTKLSVTIWVLILAAAGVWLLWVNTEQVERVAYVSGLAGGNELSIEAGSVTGYEDGLRRLILPEGDDGSYEWLLQTGQMLATDTWRLRHVDYDNAPFGREVTSPSLYRWWLLLGARADHLFSDRPVPLSIERAGLWGGPALHLIVLVGTGIVILRRFGVLASALTVILLASTLPFAPAFLAARPSALPLSLVFALWSVLPLLMSLNPGLPENPAAGSGSVPAGRTRTGFLAAGIFGGLGLWADVSRQVPILIGIALGAVALAWIRRRNHADASGNRPLASGWRIWSAAGAAVSLAGTLIEFFPQHLKWLSLEGNHPFYAIGWLAGGELLFRFESWTRGHRPTAGRAGRLLTVLCFPAVLLVPALMLLTGNRGFLPEGARLTDLPGAEATGSIFDSISRNGLSLPAVATLLPLGLLLTSLVLNLGHLKKNTGNTALLLSWAPTGIVLVVALFASGWWSLVVGLFIPVLVASVAALPRDGKFPVLAGIWIGVTLATALPGLWILSSQARAADDQAVSLAETTSLIERDLSHWLSRQVGPAGANVLAPPSLTVSLLYHGGLKGLSTPFRENQAGFAAAVRIAAATSPDEARALADRRQLTHIVIPSWDGFLDEYARIGATEPDNTLMALLHRWMAPRWLAPVAYQMPRVEGFEEDYVAIFRTVDVQDNATALSLLAEYFLEMGQSDGAVAVGQALERSFPGDLNALIARSGIAIAQRDPVRFRSVVAQIIPLLENGAGENLAWNRRVSLSIVLAQFQAALLAREQLEICLEEADEEQIRSLSTVSLFRLLSLLSAFDLEFDDPNLQTLALKLLPPQMRAEL